MSKCLSIRKRQKKGIEMISIVTPTYNSEEYLEDCIKSIKAQSYKDYEHIIIDGGSNDGTLDIIKKYEGTYPMRWISEKDNGMYDAIAKGFKMAKGDIFCWLNSDDMYMPWTLETVNKVIGKYVGKDRIQWCVGRDSRFTQNGINYIVSKRVRVFPRELIKKGWMNGIKLGCLQQESSFWARELYESVGGIDINYKLAGDFHLWKKFANEANLYSLNSVLAGFRIHTGQKSGDVRAYLAETGRISVLTKALSKIKVYKIIARIKEILNSSLIVCVETLD